MSRNLESGFENTNPYSSAILFVIKFEEFQSLVNNALKKDSKWLGLQEAQVLSLLCNINFILGKGEHFSEKAKQILHAGKIDEETKEILKICDYKELEDQLLAQNYQHNEKSDLFVRSVTPSILPEIREAFYRAKCHELFPNYSTLKIDVFGQLSKEEFFEKFNHKVSPIVNYQQKQSPKWEEN